MKKILIIAGGLHVGGAEKVCANISKYAPDGAYEFHYIVFEGLENVYGPEIEARGGTVFTLPSPSAGYLQFVKKINQLMTENDYSAIHSHTMFNSGITLALAFIHRIPCRVAHSHTTKTEHRISWKQKIYQDIMRFVIKRFSTDYMACGVQAGHWLFGKRAFDRKGIVINNGIDTVEFAFSEERRNKVRNKYNLDNKFVIGHSGSLIPLKNQGFLIKLLPKVKERIPNAVLFFLGGGDEEQKKRLISLSKELNVYDSVIWGGQVLNVYEYLNAFDIFAFPSLREGTPLALLEAQTNGLPCVISDAIPKDAYLTDLIHPLSLNDPDKWIDLLTTYKRDNKNNYPKLIEEAGYSALSSYKKIYDVYERKK